MSIPLLTRSLQRYFDIIDHHCTVVIYEPTNIHHLHGQFHYDVTISNACHVCYIQIASLCERVEPVTLSTMDLHLPTPSEFTAFPYKPPYDIQTSLMRCLYESIEQKKVAIIESPTGTVNIL